MAASDSLLPGQSLTSLGGRYTLCFLKEAGSLQLIDRVKRGDILWTSGRFQDDGNLAIYSDQSRRSKIWETRTGGRKTVMGNVLYYKQQFCVGQTLRSPGGLYTLDFDFSGNILLYQHDFPVYILGWIKVATAEKERWRTSSTGLNVTCAVLEGNGALTLYTDNYDRVWVNAGKRIDNPHYLAVEDHSHIPHVKLVAYESSSNYPYHIFYSQGLLLLKKGEFTSLYRPVLESTYPVSRCICLSSAL